MPPEIVWNSPHTKKADIWALGILLYEFLHGEPPFKANSLSEIKDCLKASKIRLKGSLSRETKDLMRKLL